MDTTPAWPAATPGDGRERGYRMSDRLSRRGMMPVPALAQALAEEGEDALPGILRGGGIVGAATVVEEGVPGVGVDLDIVGNVVAVERGVELAAVRRGEVLAGVGADHRAGALDGRERLRVDAVERGDGLEAVVGAGPGDGEAAAHAEADGAKASGIHP